MNRSDNLNLYLPENSDYRDVSQLSYNFETIDEAVGEMPPVYVTFGTSSKGIMANLQDSWTTEVPNDANPHPCKITAQYGAAYGYISRYSTSYGICEVSRYDGNSYIFYLNNGTITEKKVSFEGVTNAACTVNTSYIDSSQSSVNVYKTGRFGLLTGYFKVTTNAPVDTSLINLPSGITISSRPCYTFVHGYDNAIKGRLEVASGSASMKVSGATINAYSSYMYINMPFITG